ncbi:MAG: glycosyltransferase [Thermodesulfobacteriota bacterium]|nr:glycosyltransferase [Thermodesulfobacteriota bacterium]
MDNPKVLIVTQHFPPVLNGPSVVLSRLVKHWPKDSVSVFTRDYYGLSEEIDTDFVLDVSTTRFPWCRNHTRIDRVKEFINIRRSVKAICNEAVRRKSDVIIGVTDDGPFFISSYLAAKRLNIPLVIYMLDLYEEGRRSRLQKFFAKRYERRIFAYASTLLVMSERMQEHYKKKYGIDSIIVPHPIEGCNIVNKVYEIPQPDLLKRPMEIVFTGHLTAAQYESVMDLVKIVGENPKEFVLKLCVPELTSSERNLPPNVAMQSLSRQKVIEVQRNADVLFLSYSFNNPYPDIIRTASPGKLPEYLAAGRPIIYYGPEYSYMKWYFDRTKAALCITRPNGNDLLSALRRFKNDPCLRSYFSKNAIEASRTHESTIVADRVRRIIRNVSDAETQFDKNPPLYWLMNETSVPITGGELRYVKHLEYLRKSGWDVKSLMNNSKSRSTRVKHLWQSIKLSIKLILQPSGIVIEDASTRDRYIISNILLKAKHKFIAFSLEPFLIAEDKTLSKNLFNIYFRSLDKVIVASCYMKDWVKKMGAREEDICIVPDAPRIRGTGFHEKTLNNPVRILCVAHIRKNKRQDILIQALSLLERNKFELRFAGAIKDEQFFNDLKKTVKQLHLENEVKWLGFLGEDGIKIEYENADLFVLPTHYEGFGQAVLEAMSFGLPIITAKVGALEELIEDGKHGILINADNSCVLATAIDRLVEDENLRIYISKNTAERAANYASWNQVNAQLSEILSTLK